MSFASAGLGQFATIGCREHGDDSREYGISWCNKIIVNCVISYHVRNLLLLE